MTCGHADNVDTITEGAMRRQSVWVFLLLAMLSGNGCEEAKEAGKAIVKKGLEQATKSDGKADNAGGLKAALEAGVGKAIETLAKKGGFGNDQKMRIPFPPKAQAAADKLRQLGLGALVDLFVDKLNQAAEDAVAKARPIFVAAIKNMTIKDARAILFGANDAATRYFETRTREELYKTFKPIIRASLDSVGAATQWRKLVDK